MEIIYYQLLDVKFILLYVIYPYIAVTHAHTYIHTHTSTDDSSRPGHSQNLVYCLKQLIMRKHHHLLTLVCVDLRTCCTSDVNFTQIFLHSYKWCHSVFQHSEA